MKDSPRMTRSIKIQIFLVKCRSLGQDWPSLCWSFLKAAFLILLVGLGGERCWCARGQSRWVLNPAEETTETLKQPPATTLVRLEPTWAEPICHQPVNVCQPLLDSFLNFSPEMVWPLGPGSFQSAAFSYSPLLHLATLEAISLGCCHCATLREPWEKYGKMGSLKWPKLPKWPWSKLEHCQCSLMILNVLYMSLPFSWLSNFKSVWIGRRLLLEGLLIRCSISRDYCGSKNWSGE